MPYISPEARATLLEQYRQHLRSLDTLQPLAFVSLNQFDEKLYPIAKKRDSHGVTTTTS
ncbi:hypothetical protein D9M68_617110 [compost metagenome]